MSTWRAYLPGQDIVPGKWHAGFRGRGVLGSQIPSTGTHGPGYVYPSLDLPADNDKEYHARINTLPSAGTFVGGDDSSFLLIGAPDGEYSLVFRLFEDGVDLGLVTATFNVGPVSLAASAAMQSAATGALEVLRNLQAAASASGQATGELAHSVPLSGAAAAQATGSGALALTVQLTSAAVGGAAATGALSTASGLQAAAVGQATATGQLALSIALGGAALASAAATGEFVGQVLLAGSAAAAAGVEGMLNLVVPLGADAAAMVSATGALTLTMLLGGAAQAQAFAQGSLLGDVVLAGSAGASVVVTGELFVFAPSVTTVRAYQIIDESRSRTLEAQTRTIAVDAQGRSFVP